VVEIMVIGVLVLAEGRKLDKPEKKTFGQSDNQ